MDEKGVRYRFIYGSVWLHYNGRFSILIHVCFEQVNVLQFYSSDYKKSVNLTALYLNVSLFVASQLSQYFKVECMDPLSDIIQLLSIRSYITTGQSGGNHWAMRYPGFDGMKFISIRKGALWFRLDTENSWRQLHVGDGVIITRQVSFILATSPDITVVESVDIPYIKKEGLADYGGDDNILLAGKMEIDTVSGGYILAMLPDVIPIFVHSDESSSLSWLMSKLHNEIQQAKPCASLICSNLMQLIMLEGLRSWILFDQNKIEGWLGGLRDARITQALMAIHREPEKNWQLMDLANIAGMSRASFARTFHNMTGTSPLSYVTHWRMHIASKSLRVTNESIKHLAFRLGYSSESTFSSVFRRIYGVSPSLHRKNNTKGLVDQLANYQNKL